MLDYSKGQLSRARTADHYPGQSTSGPFYNPQHLNYSGAVDPRLVQTKFYGGDASQYAPYYRGQPTQSYQQYAHRNQTNYRNNTSRLQGYVQGQRQLHPQYQQQYLYQSYQQPQQQVSYPSQTYGYNSAQYGHGYHQHHTNQAPQQEYRRQFLSFRPMMANEVNQVPQPNYSALQRRMQETGQQAYDFKVFCPACHQEYYNSQVQEHIERHYLYNTDQFKLSNVLDTTHASQLDQTPPPLTVPSRFYYPLIQPQQFQCKQLDQVHYMNKYKLETQDINRKQSDVRVKSQGTQFAKPPLQIRSQNTDIYNCFDNIFSSKNKFSMDDVTKFNTVVAKKRDLEDWEKLRSQKEGYRINKK